MYGSDGKLHAIDAATGGVLWIGVTQLGTPTSPVVAQGRVLVHVGGSLYASMWAAALTARSASRAGTPRRAVREMWTPVVVNGVARWRHPAD